MSPACPSISYFYPRPPRGGRPATTSLTSTHKGISIHALREEGDAFQKLLLVFDCLFLSTPSARRATSSTKGSYTTPVTFLSTPSARRATPTAARPIRHPPYFYPRPPRGGRRLLGGAAVVNDGISIHALREEGDAGRCRNTYLPGYFYPRPPRGGRLVFFEVVQHIVPFLSTPSARRATFRHDHRRDRRRISIHALREEGDLLPAFLTRWTTRFLSTPSARRATWSFLSLVRHPSRFLSTPSARRATPHCTRP